MQTNKPTAAQTSLQTLSREAFWQRHVEQWRESKKSKMAYCKQHALTYHQFIYWCSKADSAEVNLDHASNESGFVAVSVSPMVNPVGLCVRLPNGITLDGIDEHSANWVAKLVRQL